jgi:hypothetical protein
LEKVATFLAATAFFTTIATPLTLAFKWNANKSVKTLSWYALCCQNLLWRTVRLSLATLTSQEKCEVVDLCVCWEI